MNRHDTILAVSSPPGRALRGLIRLSGPEAGAILQRLLAPGSNITESRTLFVCSWRLPGPGAPGSGPAATLPALAATFAAPHSYTGEALAELQVPGNPALLDRVVRAALALGARPAEPGEFTFRAFLAGKLDLTQAEGIAATIAAVSDGQLQAAALLREGRLGRVAADLVTQLGEALALVEAGIDFADQDDVTPIGPEALSDRLAGVAARLDELLTHSRSWGALDALPRAVLVGPPNSGKSTLFNALLGRRRALTSPIPGTTRDVLAEPLTLSVAGRHAEILLVDIAGLDAAQTTLDHQVQAAARAAIAHADVIMETHDGARMNGHATAPSHAAPGSAVRRLPVVTKSDLREPGSPVPAGALLVSARTGRGLPELRTALAQVLAQRTVGLSAQMLALQPRHEQALRSAADHLAQARALLATPHGGRGIARVELVAASVRAALDSLACLGGKLTPDDVIGRIFATFCIGK